MSEQEYDRFFLKVCVAMVVGIFVFVSGYQCGISRLDGELQVDTLRVNDTVWQSFPVLVESEPVVVSEPVDTAAIVQAYFSMNVFRDTVVLKEFGTLTVTDTVFMNRIGGREFVYDLQVPTVAAGELPRAGFGVGAFMQRDSWGLVGSVRLKRWLLSGGYDFCNGTPHFGAQYMFGQ